MVLSVLSDTRNRKPAGRGSIGRGEDGRLTVLVDSTTQSKWDVMESVHRELGRQDARFELEMTCSGGKAMRMEQAAGGIMVVQRWEVYHSVVCQ